jgi:DNA-binding MarR family transcriptional regulator
MNDDNPSYYMNSPGHIGRDCLAFNVRKAARILARAYDEALSPCSLKSTQYSILVGIHVRGAVAMQEFADLMKMDRTTLTRNLKPLERRGLLSLSTGRDRRSRSIALTPEGEKLLRKAIPLWEGVQNNLVSALGFEATERFYQGLATLSKITER